MIYIGGKINFIKDKNIFNQKNYFVKIIEEF